MKSAQPTKTAWLVLREIDQVGARVVQVQIPARCEPLHVVATCEEAQRLARAIVTEGAKT